MRFADDFVGCFQFQDDAQNFQSQLRERFARFNLELAEDKTRLLLFGRFAAVMRGSMARSRRLSSSSASNMSVGWIGGGDSP